VGGRTKLVRSTGPAQNGNVLQLTRPWILAIREKREETRSKRRAPPKHKRKKRRTAYRPNSKSTSNKRKRNWGLRDAAFFRRNGEEAPIIWLERKEIISNSTRKKGMKVTLHDVVHERSRRTPETYTLNPGAQTKGQREKKKLFSQTHAETDVENERALPALKKVTKRRRGSTW